MYSVVYIYTKKNSRHHKSIVSANAETMDLWWREFIFLFPEKEKVRAKKSDELAQTQGWSGSR